MIHIRYYRGIPVGNRCIKKQSLKFHYLQIFFSFDQKTFLNYELRTFPCYYKSKSHFVSLLVNAFFCKILFSLKYKFLFIIIIIIIIIRKIPSLYHTKQTENTKVKKICIPFHAIIIESFDFEYV